MRFVKSAVKYDPRYTRKGVYRSSRSFNLMDLVPTSNKEITIFNNILYRIDMCPLHLQ